MRRAEVLEAINFATRGHHSHAVWAEHLANHGDCDRCTPEVVATAGDEACHVEWVRGYDLILRALKEHPEIAGTL